VVAWLTSWSIFWQTAPKGASCREAVRQAWALCTAQDGTWVTTADTPENQGVNPQQKVQKFGGGFPIARLLVSELDWQFWGRRFWIRSSAGRRNMELTLGYIKISPQMNYLSYQIPELAEWKIRPFDCLEAMDDRRRGRGLLGCQCAVDVTVRNNPLYERQLSLTPLRKDQVCVPFDLQFGPK
jgi:hypothetical protein